GAERLSWNQPFVVIGRTPGMDVVLDDPAVSRRHAYLQVIGNRVACVDLGSRTGVFWGSERRHSGWLKSGEAVRMGPFRIRLEEPGLDPAAAAEEPTLLFPLGPERPQNVALEFSTATTKPSLWRLRHRLMLVGHDPECQVRLLGPGVSRYHCSLVNTPG